MNENQVKNLTIWLLVFVSIILVYFLIATAIDGYWIWNYDKLDFAATGQVGDFIGGFLGTIISAAAFYFLYLTLNEQRKSGVKQSFESRLYQLINLHRDNINELEYTKFYKSKLEKSVSRKVFRVVVEEFMDCFHEVKRFEKMYPELEIFKPDYQTEISKIRKANNSRATLKELAFIDIAFCFFYFGVSKESDTILLHKFYNRYDKEFMIRLKTFLQLKPKQEKKKAYKEWKKFVGKNVSEMKISFEQVYNHYRNTNKNSIDEEYKNLFSNLKLVKYYGGHQHRFGHYFRHLFQSFKYLSQQNFLTEDERYFYGKSIRSQLSTYEQYLLFFNSLSSIGMRWEYNADIENLENGNLPENFKFITRYNLIKNLPGSQYYEFGYRKFYPKVDFEYKEDITYKKKKPVANTV
jgi:hypothetical protein